MLEHTFEVEIKVRGQGRPKTDFLRRRVYKAKEDRKYEDAIKAAYINSNGAYFGDKPIAMRVDVFRALPTRTPKRIRYEHDTHKPDASNILKSVEDALNGIAYVDDAQIVEGYVVKHPRERVTERIVVTIREVA